MKPTVADSRTPNRLILRGPTGDLPAVTAEAAVPLIFTCLSILEYFSTDKANIGAP
jgi:ABC-type uncharacterized transport system permease subunit